MWATLVAPLFDGIGALMSNEFSVSVLEEAYLLWKGTFKQFMLIPKSTSSEVVYQMIGIDLVELIFKNKEAVMEKWEHRKKGMKVGNDGFTKVQRYNPLIGIPKEFCQIIRVEGQICIPCWKKGIKIVINQKHLEDVHGIEILGYQRLWTEIRDYFVEKKKQIFDKPLKRLNREEFRKKWLDVIKTILTDTYKKIAGFCKLGSDII